MMNVPSHLPAFLAIKWQEFQEETNPRLKLWTLCEVYEILLRFGTAVTLAEFRALPDGDARFDTAISTIAPEIEGPSLGKWLGLLKDLTDQFQPSDQLVLPEFGIISETLFEYSPEKPVDWTASLLHIRNTLAHGGSINQKAAERLLEEWEPKVADLIDLLAFLANCKLVWFENGIAHNIEPDGRQGEIIPLATELSDNLAATGLNRRVLLLRENRWIDLWPLCDFAATTMPGFGSIVTSQSSTPQIYFRAEKRRLLYAALGSDLPIHQSTDQLAAFRAFFRLDRPTEKSVGITADFAGDIAAEAKAMCGRREQLLELKKVVKKASCGVLWVSGPGGIGKSYLISKFAQNQLGSNQYITVFWRFRANDADRCNRHAFFRHAIRTLSDPKFGLRSEPTFPSLDPSQLLVQFLDLLRDANTRNPERQVLFILDGMDEIARSDGDFVRSIADWHFGHAIWLCVGRHEGDQIPTIFATDRCQHVFPGGLPGMASTEIREMIDARIGSRLKDLLRQDEDADDGTKNELVDAIAARAAGLPLYVHFVCEDLLSGQLPLDSTLPSRLPNKLEDYFEKLLKQAEADDEDAIPSPLIAVCAWALEPPTEDFLLELLARREVLDRVDPAYSRNRLRSVIDRVGSILRPVQLADGKLGYEPYHLTFRDHIREDRTDRRRIQNRKAREVFVQMTLDWLKLPIDSDARQYVLLHGSEHLLQEKRYDNLTSLAQDEEFLAAQRRELPTDPSANIRTLQHALTGACEQDSGVRMAEAVLRLADGYQQFHNASPLELLRAGKLDGAMTLADLQDAERRVLWYLLLAWEMSHRHQTDAIPTVLRRLFQRANPILDNWKADLTCDLLTWLTPEVFPQFLEAAMALLPQQIYVKVVEQLLKQYNPTLNEPELRASIDHAMLKTNWQELWHVCSRIAEAIPKEWDRTTALTEIAVNQAQAENVDAAIKTAEAIPKEWGRTTALTEIAVKQAQAGNVDGATDTFSKALQTAMAIPRGWSCSEALREIAVAQAQAGNVEEAKKTLNKAIKTAEAISDEKERSRALREIAVAQAQAGNVEGATDTFNKAIQTAEAISDEKERSWALREIAVCQAQAGNVEEALQTTEAISDEKDRSRALREIASAQAQAGYVDAAIKTAEAIPYEWHRRTALTEIAVNQAQAGNVDAAIKTAEAISDEWHRSMALTEIAVKQAQAGNVDGATDTFSTAIKTAEAIQVRYRRSEPLREIASAQAQAGDLVGAIQTAEAISDEKERSEALREIAAAQAQAGYVDGATDTFSKAIQTAEAIPREEYRSTALREIASAQAQAGYVDGATDTFSKAIQTAEAIPREEYRSTALREIASAQAQAGDLVGAIQTAEVIPDEEDRSTALRVIAVKQAQAGNVDAAIKTAEAISDEKERSTALTEIAVKQAQAGNVDAAIKTAEAISEEWQRSRALREIAVCHAQAGNVEEALQTTEAISDEKDRSTALTEIAVNQAQAGNVDAAIKTAEAISDEWHRSMALTEIAVKQAQAGNVDGATDTFSKALQTAEAVSHEWHRSTALTEIAVKQAQAGNVDGATDTFSKAIKTAEAISEEWQRSRALREIAVCQAQAGNVEEALQATEAIPNESYRSYALSAIASAQAQAGNVEEALQTTEAISVERHRSTALTEIAVNQAQAGNVDGATDTFSKAIKTAEAISDEWDRSRALTEIAVNQAQAGNMDGATDTFNKAIQTAEAISKEKERSRALREIAVNQASAGFSYSGVATGMKILIDVDEYLPAIAERIVEQRDYAAFKLYLPLAGRDIRTAIHACGLLARLNPPDATAIAALLIARHDKPSA
ncbi:MAG: hypothetical protein R3B84_09845 [Zavarzinella sp.]